MTIRVLNPLIVKSIKEASYLSKESKKFIIDSCYKLSLEKWESLHGMSFLLSTLGGPISFIIGYIDATFSDSNPKESKQLIDEFNNRPEKIYVHH